VLLIDTGIFVSAADRDEPRHDVCAGLLRGRRDLTV
jgi:predicted nucleic acid-binding protein